ncbi:MAG: glycerol-3-phosphate 1-O-acyltransferase PlsY [Hydrogenibacillus schlegelii]|nr:glycerol-3-phosphate 1-O-acyltransferase PlsY [Hydrogenibacillus schlegelii]
MTLLAFVLAYLLGSVPFGLLFARAVGVDLLRCGSGNIGTTNAFRCAGPVVGTLTLVFDVLKGLAGVFLLAPLVHAPWALYATGFLIILGHTKSAFLRFRGGKAIATSFGVLLYLNPWAILLAAAAFAAVVAWTRTVSLGSITAGVVYPLLTPFFRHDPLFILLSYALGAYAIWLHRENIRRLLAGEEPKFTFGPRRDRPLR